MKHTPIILISIIILCLSCGVVSAAVPVVTNGGFEDGNLTGWYDEGSGYYTVGVETYAEHTGTYGYAASIDENSGYTDLYQYSIDDIGEFTSITFYYQISNYTPDIDDNVQIDCMIVIDGYELGLTIYDINYNDEVIPPDGWVEVTLTKQEIMDANGWTDETWNTRQGNFSALRFFTQFSGNTSFEFYLDDICFDCDVPAAPTGYNSTFILEILALILLFLLASIFSEENVRFGYVLIPFVAAFFWWAGFIPFAYMTTIIPLMIFMGLFSFMRMQAKYKWGVGGTSGGILYKIVFFLIMIQMVIGYVNGMGMFATNSVVTPDNEYTQYTLTSAQSVYGANSFGIDAVDMVTNGIQIMWMSFKVLWTMLASVFFIYPTLVNQFHIPVELSALLQTGIYIIYGLELFNMIFKPFKAAEV